MIPWLIQYFYTYAIYILIQILVDYVQIANNRCILRCDAHVRKTLIRGRLLTWSESEAVQGSLGVGANWIPTLVGRNTVTLLKKLTIP